LAPLEEPWCHSGASTTPVNTHMVNWLCDVMRDRESTMSMRETEREVAHGIKPLAGNRRDESIETKELAWPFLLSISLPSYLSLIHAFRHILLYHTNWSNKELGTEKLPCPL